MSTPINQSSARSFEIRLADFGPELGGFLRSAWNTRSSVNLQDGEVGIQQLYVLYSGPDARVPTYHRSKLVKFVTKIKQIGMGMTTYVQGVFGIEDFDALGQVAISSSGRDLWTAFYHFIGPGGATKRVYAHCASVDAGLIIIEAAVGWMTEIPGFASIKICGPGAIERNDTIVAYVADTAAQSSLVERIQQLAQRQNGLLAEGLPSIVRRVDRGIGTSDEPPEIEVLRGGGTRHSFGSLYATLIWIALKTTPDVGKPTADGRHFLDNMLYIQRTLQVDPGAPQQFPARAQLEDLQAKYNL